MLSKSYDPILSDLASRLLNRNLFDYMDNTNESEKLIKKKLKENGYDPKYYLAKDEVGQKPYVPYSNDAGNAIWVRKHGGEIQEISSASAIVKSLVKGQILKDDRIYYPKEIR